jgi:PIN domain nuclease of toxin-antitoxin system
MGGGELRYLLDTSVWLRAIVEPETIPPKVQQILDGRNEQFGLAPISLWEVAKKQQIGKLKLQKDLNSWLRQAVAAHIQLLPMTTEIASEAMMLPAFPNRDPADELIVATARIHQLTLLTTDAMLKNYRHATIHYFVPILVH